MQKFTCLRLYLNFNMLFFMDFLTFEYETTTLSQDISHQFYIAMAPCPEEQKPELHLHKSLKVAC